MTAAETWRKRLRPWLRALRTRMYYHLPPLPSHGDFEDLWVGLKAPDGHANNPEMWTLVIEAMELLELLARVDLKAAWAIIMDHSNTAKQLDLFDDEPFKDGEMARKLLPKFEIQVSCQDFEGDDGIDTTQGLIRLIVPKDLKRASAKYATVKRALLKEWSAENDERGFDREKEGRVRVALKFITDFDLDSELVDVAFENIVNVATAIADPSVLVVQTPEERARLEQERDEEEEEGEEDEDEGESEASAGEANRDAAEGREDEEGAGGDDSERDEQRSGTSVASSDDEDDDEELSDGETGGVVEGNHPQPHCSVYKIEAFRYELIRYPVTNTVLHYISAAASLGLAVSDLSICGMVHEWLHHSIIGGFLLNMLVPWGGRREAIGIKRLMVDRGDAAAVRALCTVVAHSRSLRHVVFEKEGTVVPHWNVVPSDVWWSWVAYAIFSRSAQHNIDTVTLNVSDLTSSSVEAIRAVLNHNDPLAFLYQKTSSRIVPSTDSPVMMATLKPKALLRIGHHRVVPEGTRQNSVRVGESGVRYQVVCNRPEDEFVEVILPGTGVCWADRADIVKLTELPVREIHPVRHLKLASFDDVDLDSVLELLQLVGSHITSLTLDFCHGDAVNDAFFDAVSEACVHVKHFTIMSARIASWRWLYDRQDAQRPRFQLESLSLHELEGLQDPDEWTALFSALSGPSHSLTRSLREFHFSFDENTSEDVVELHMKCIEMLDDNHRLTRMEWSYIDIDDDVQGHFAGQLEKRNKAPVCVEKAPLSAKEKLALLSVMTPITIETAAKKSKTSVASSAPLARHALTPHLIQVIMEYAAHPRHRRCAGHVAKHLHPLDRVFAT